MSATDFLDAYLNQHCKTALHTSQNSKRRQTHLQAANVCQGTKHDAKHKAEANFACQPGLVPAPPVTPGNSKNVQTNKAHTEKRSPRGKHNLYIAKLYDLSDVQHQQRTVPSSQAAGSAKNITSSQQSSSADETQQHPKGT